MRDTTRLWKFPAIGLIAAVSVLLLMAWTSGRLLEWVLTREGALDPDFIRSVVSGLRGHLLLIGFPAILLIVGFLAWILHRENRDIPLPPEPGDLPDDPADVRQLRQLEKMRRDFVANVSHELKTPITSIKGFMETLLEGKTDDPEDVRRFLGIIAKQADRLDAIIEDLLSLSRLELEYERGDITLTRERISDVLKAAMHNCADKAAPKRIRMQLECPDLLSARINAPLLEQAVTNLIDNAVKYSDEDRNVEIAASETGKEVVISVRDEGHGIAEKYLTRIFERFYRVDKSRSRKLGGTGLGLSIVKHIAQAHGGTVSVQSEPGQGSTFSVHLPK